VLLPSGFVGALLPLAQPVLGSLILGDDLAALFPQWVWLGFFCFGWFIYSRWEWLG